jgi:hypothetical protein
MDGARHHRSGLAGRRNSRKAQMRNAPDFFIDIVDNEHRPDDANGTSFDGAGVTRLSENAPHDDQGGSPDEQFRCGIPPSERHRSPTRGG